jgi:murein DD-endopeptidase MepM/ murein hydrolase activator NlpD
MRKPIYRYNFKTCRYEASKITFGAIAGYVFGLVLTACALMIGLLLLHDFVIDSEKEVSLRKENKAMEKHSVILTHQLDEIENTLSELHTKDRELHNKFFTVTTENETRRSISREEILLGDAAAFRQSMSLLEQLTQQRLRDSQTSVENVSGVSGLDKLSLEIIGSIPFLPPIATLSEKNLLSGFGLRINPFHKGLYDHTGIDIATVRGTEVVATASGQVTDIKKSTLQAGYGNYIEIDHGHGFISRYAHLEDIYVRLGQAVDKGMVIGTTGNSGGSIAPHLHYEIIRDGKNVNPVLCIIEGISDLQHDKLISVGQKQNQSLD